MAVEVDQGEYQYITTDVKPTAPPQEIKTLSRLDRQRAEMAGKKQDAAISTPRVLEEKAPVFRYNTLHDLESVLWIAFDAVVNHERKLASDPQNDAIALTQDEREVAAKLFYNAAERAQAMSLKKGIIDKTLRNLPPPLKEIGASLLLLKEALIAQYKTAEANPASIGADACGELYDTFYLQFMAIRNVLDRTGDVIVEPLEVELDYSVRKKPRLTKGSARSSNKRPAADDLSNGSKKQKSTQATA